MRFDRVRLPLAVAHCLSAISCLAEAVFNCYLKRDYPEHYHYYEEELHACCCKVWQALARVRGKYPHQAMLLEKLADNLLSLAILRLRVTDHSIFEVAHQELQAIITSLLIMLAGKGTIEELLENICEFEVLNRNVLQTLAREPLAFLLFTYDLHSLHGLCHQLMTI